jgi:AcrR family transcriptional regulator
MASNREAILEAAIRIASRDGLLAMTLDGVAREAGVSKGGLVYHFPSKDALVTGMLEHFAHKKERAIEAVAGTENPTPRQQLHAFLRIAFGGDGIERELDLPKPVKLIMAILAASVNNPELLAPMRQCFERRRAELMADADGFDLLLIWLAVEGLLLWELLGLIDKDDPLRGRVVGDLLARLETPQVAFASVGG